MLFHIMFTVRGGGVPVAVSHIGNGHRLAPFPSARFNMAETVTLDYLANMIKARFSALAKDISAVHGRLDLLTASVNDIAATQASHGEISAVHAELDRLRQQVTDQEARLLELEQPDA